MVEISSTSFGDSRSRKNKLSNEAIDLKNSIGAIYRNGINNNS
jgi:hypothetical protein